MCIKTHEKKRIFEFCFKEFLHLNPLVVYLAVNFGIAFDYYHLLLQMMPYLPCRVIDLHLLNKIYRHSLLIDYWHL
jgi:hypothetical protein